MEQPRYYRRNIDENLRRLERQAPKDPEIRLRWIVEMLRAGHHVLAFRRVVEWSDYGDDVFMYLYNFVKGSHWDTAGKPSQLFASGINSARGISLKNITQFYNFISVESGTSQAEIFICDRCSRKKDHPYGRCNYCVWESGIEWFRPLPAIGLGCVRCGEKTVAIERPPNQVTNYGHEYPPLGTCSTCNFQFHL